MLLDKEGYKRLLKAVEKAFNDTEIVMDLYQIGEKEAEQEINEYSAIRNDAALGNKLSREYIIHTYAQLIKYFDYSLTDIEGLVDFDNIQRNSVRVLFDMLVMSFDMADLIDEYGMQTQYDEEDVRKMVEEREESIRSKFSYYEAQVEFLATFMYVESFGASCMDALQFHNINEVGTLREDYIYIVYKGQKIWLSFLRLGSREVLVNLQKKLSGNATTQFDQKNPAVVTAKENSNRITVAGFEMVPDEDSLYYNERVFNIKKINLEEMSEKYDTIDQDIYDFLILNQKGKGSHFVSGSDMGIGKSTFLLAMFEKIPDFWGTGVLDTQNELQAHRKYPWKNVVTLLENEHRSIDKCFEIMLKQARDVLYVGEITKPAEVQELVNASLRLNSGVGATIHSYSPNEIVPNLRNLLMRTEMYDDAEMAEIDISRAMDLVIHLKKIGNGRIIVDSISEVEFIERESYVEDQLMLGEEYSYEQKLMNTLDLMQQSLAKSLYKKSYKLNTLFKYDEEIDGWRKHQTPSEAYFRKMGTYLSKDELLKMRAIFKEVE